MIIKRKVAIRCIMLLLVAGLLCNATTWTPVKIKCPYCGTKSVYYKVNSYGPYIYDYPSKYEYIFWPYIDGKVLYCCRKCWFTSFAWDFFSIPGGAREDIKRILSKMAVFETNGDYDIIPMYYRMEIAENIYKLYEKDDEFWCHFYRVEGYHLANEGKIAEAAEARSKALQYTVKMIADPSNAGIGKELYYIKGAMQYLLADTEKALATFKLARQMKYYNVDADSNRLENVNKYLDDLIDHYIEKIESAK